MSRENISWLSLNAKTECTDQYNGVTFLNIWAYSQQKLHVGARPQNFLLSYPLSVLKQWLWVSCHVQGTLVIVLLNMLTVQPHCFFFFCWWICLFSPSFLALKHSTTQRAEPKHAIMVTDVPLDLSHHHITSFSFIHIWNGGIYSSKSQTFYSMCCVEAFIYKWNAREGGDWDFGSYNSGRKKKKTPKLNMWTLAWTGDSFQLLEERAEKKHRPKTLL